VHAGRQAHRQQTCNVPADTKRLAQLSPPRHEQFFFQQHQLPQLLLALLPCAKLGELKAKKVQQTHQKTCIESSNRHRPDLAGRRRYVGDERARGKVRKTIQTLRNLVGFQSVPGLLALEDVVCLLDLLPQRPHSAVQGLDLLLRHEELFLIDELSGTCMFVLENMFQNSTHVSEVHRALK
jgi:hypothetical protein